MYRRNVLNTLLSLGVHIGHLSSNTKASNHFFITGTRYGIEVLDINYILISLQRSVQLLYQIGTLNGDLLFHITSLHSYNIQFRHYFVHLISIANKQRIFDEKWVYGQLSNFRQNALYFIYKIFFINKKYIHFYKKHRWNNTSMFKISIHSTKIGRKRRRKKKLGFLPNLGVCNFINLLIRVFFYSYFKKFSGISFKQHQMRMLKFFKFIVIFKHFRTFLCMPDAFIIFNPNNIIAPVSEVLRYKIPVIGLLDSNGNSFGLTYPIYSNDDSILLIMFYIKLFLRAFKLGKINNLLYIE